MNYFFEINHALPFKIIQSLIKSQRERWLKFFKNVDVLYGWPLISFTKVQIKKKLVFSQHLSNKLPRDFVDSKNTPVPNLQTLWQGFLLKHRLDFFSSRSFKQCKTCGHIIFSHCVNSQEKNIKMNTSTVVGLISSIRICI